MNYNLTPKVYAKVSSDHRKVPTSNYSYSDEDTYTLPSINYSSHRKSSLFSQVVTAAGPVKAFRPSSYSSYDHANPTAKALSRAPSRLQNPTTHKQQTPKSQKYHYGPTSTSNSIAASTVGSSKQYSSQETVATVGYEKSPQSQAHRSYHKIEYSSLQNQGVENTLALRSTQRAPIGNGGNYKEQITAHVGPIKRVLTVPSGPILPPAKGKFFQSSGLKVRKEFSANSKHLPTEKPKTLMLMAPGDAVTRSPGSSLVTTNKSTSYTKPPPLNNAKDGLSSSNPKNLYTSILGSKSVSLSLSSSKQPNPLKVSAANCKEPSEIHSGDGSVNIEYSIDNKKNQDKLNEPTETSLQITSSGNTEEICVSNMQTKQARSVRKIQDLEISNASLMAVNKYLEKKLRSQSENIQHLRTKSNEPELGVFHSDSEDEGHESSSGEEDTNLFTESQPSADELILTEKTKLIEQRMQSHIRFLESSEKVNQTMRNCLLISSSLLKEASTSLEYEVDPTDQKYGYYTSNHDFIDTSLTESSEPSATSSPQSHLSVENSRPIFEPLIEHSSEDENGGYGDYNKIGQGLVLTQVARQAFKHAREHNYSYHRVVS